jgi:DNA-binding NarL/FixJ family response regulator
MTGRMRIFVIDAQVVFREGLKSVLGAFSDCDLVGEAATAEEALPLIQSARPDLIVVDFVLSSADRRGAIAAFKERAPAAEVALLTSSAVAQDLNDAVSAGALGYVLKSEPIDAIVRALRRVARGQQYVTPDLERIFDRLRHARFPATVLDVLSPRERHVFRLVTDGLDTAEIAQQFGVSRKTIETHKCRILKKFGLSSTAALVRFAAVQGLMALAPA